MDARFQAALVSGANHEDQTGALGEISALLQISARMQWYQVMQTIELIHYGADVFDPLKFSPIQNRKFVKPFGGLWASPVGAEYGWKEWCEENVFNTNLLEKSMRLQITGNIIVIDNVSDLDALPWIEDRFTPTPDFEEILASGIDAIHLTTEGQWATRMSTPRHLYGWDCESVLVLQPSGLVQI